MKRIIIFLFLLPLLANGQIITTIAGGSTIGLGDGGPANAASFGGPVYGFATDKHGNLFIADWWNHRVRKVDVSTGIITTIAGSGIHGYNGDSILATSAQLFGPKFVAIDTFGNLFVSESLNQRVRKIDTNGIITTYAGTGFGSSYTGMSHSFSGDGGPATNATFDGPAGLALDTYGNLYISDNNNHRIRKIDAVTHIISTIAGRGTGSYWGDGVPATDAYLVNVYDIAIDIYNNIFLADIGDSSNRIRKIESTSQLIHSIAGTGIALYNGDSISCITANLGPYSVVADAIGNVYISDYVNNRIRKVDGETGIITTFAGTGFGSFSGDFGLAKHADIYEPAHLAFDSCGNLYFSDAANVRIRKITFDTSCHFGLTETKNIANSQSLTLFPNPAKTQLSITSSNKIQQIVITNILGQAVFSKIYNSFDVNIDILSFRTGIYFIKINETEIERFIKN